VRAVNVAMVWCPNAEDTPAAGWNHWMRYYPGDDQVDWVCADVYAGTRLAPLGDLLQPFLSWARTRPKPIVIGEFGVARAWGPATRAADSESASFAFLRTARVFFADLFSPPARPRQLGQKTVRAWPHTSHFSRTLLTALILDQSTLWCQRLPVSLCVILCDPPSEKPSR